MGKHKIGLIVFCIALAGGAWWMQSQDDNRVDNVQPVSQLSSPPPATATADPYSQPLANPPTESGAVQPPPENRQQPEPTAEREPSQSSPELRSLASQIENFKMLPTPTDQNWVLETASNSLKAGLIAQDQLSTHISELSSVRMATVADREAPYVDSEMFDDNAHGNEEGL